MNTRPARLTVGRLLPVLAAFLLFAAAMGCGPEAPPTIRSHVSGTLSVRAEVDSSGDGSGFEVAVLSAPEGDIDTLAYAVTDASGAFTMDVVAPEKGVYPLVVSRGDAPLALEELVLADGDSVTVRGTFPLNGRPMRIVSRENAAWAAVRNTKASFSEAVSTLLRKESYTLFEMGSAVLQTSNVLWSLRDVYAGTMGALLGEAESVVMLEGWNDSLLVARLGQLPVDHPNVVEMVRAARRSMARLAGQDSAIALLEHYATVVPENRRSAVRSEVVVARIDSLQRTEALAVAREIIDAGGTWGDWAGRAVYELENLMPGMEAPGFTAVDRAGEPVDLSRFRGSILMLEFYRPDASYINDLVTREALLGLSDRMPFSAVSVSVEPDSLLDDALFEGRELSGTWVHDADGLDGTLARAYNVNVLPTRVLIDADGRIVAKYVGTGLDPLQRDLGVLLRQYSTP